MLWLYDILAQAAVKEADQNREARMAEAAATLAARANDGGGQLASGGPKAGVAIADADDSCQTVTKSRARFARPPEADRDIESGVQDGEAAPVGKDVRSGEEAAKAKQDSGKGAAGCEESGTGMGGGKEDKGGDGKEKEKEKPRRPPRKWMKALGVKHEDEHQTLKNLGGRRGLLCVVLGAICSFVISSRQNSCTLLQATRQGLLPNVGAVECCLTCTHLACRQT